VTFLQNQIASFLPKVAIPEEVEATPPGLFLGTPMVDDIKHSLCTPLQRGGGVCPPSCIDIAGLFVLAALLPTDAPTSYRVPVEPAERAKVLIVLLIVDATKA
jgi:hypothetical protein